MPCMSYLCMQATKCISVRQKKILRAVIGGKKSECTVHPLKKFQHPLLRYLLLQLLFQIVKVHCFRMPHMVGHSVSHCKDAECFFRWCTFMGKDYQHILFSKQYNIQKTSEPYYEILGFTVLTYTSVTPAITMHHPRTFSSPLVQLRYLLSKCFLSLNCNH